MADELTENMLRKLSRQELDRWLWAYEARLLEPDEENTLAWFLAGNPEAKARLTEIRQHGQSVIERSGLSLQSIRPREVNVPVDAESLIDQAVRTFLHEWRELQAEVTAIVVRVGDSLHLRTIQRGWVQAAAQPVLLDARSSSATPATRQDLVGPDGTKIAVLQVQNRSPRLLLELADKNSQGTALLIQLRKQSGAVIKSKASVCTLKNGFGEFRSCPEGLFQIEFSGPNLKPILLAITLLPAPSGTSMNERGKT